MDFYIPKKRTKPFIPLVDANGNPVLVFDFGTLDGHQLEEITAKIKEQKPRRLLVPKHIAITRLLNRKTKQPTGYIVEQKEA